MGWSTAGVRVRLIVSSLFLDEVSIFYLSGVFIGPSDIEMLSSRDRLFIPLDTLWYLIHSGFILFLHSILNGPMGKS